MSSFLILEAAIERGVLPIILISCTLIAIHVLVWIRRIASQQSLVHYLWAFPGFLLLHDWNLWQLFVCLVCSGKRLLLWRSSSITGLVSLVLKLFAIDDLWLACFFVFQIGLGMLFFVSCPQHILCSLWTTICTQVVLNLFGLICKVCQSFTLTEYMLLQLGFTKYRFSTPIYHSNFLCSIILLALLITQGQWPYIWSIFSTILAEQFLTYAGYLIQLISLVEEFLP